MSKNSIPNLTHKGILSDNSAKPKPDYQTELVQIWRKKLVDKVGQGVLMA
jgi:hypothetical protein